MIQPGKLFLLPVPINEHEALQHIPALNMEIVRGLNTFIVEDAKVARRFLKLFSYPAIEKAEMLVLNEHTTGNNLEFLLQPLLSGLNVGLMSDAGCPGIADPGAEVIALAHQRGMEVVPLAGPSSIVLSIMASGFNGQNFAFVGYLPIDKYQRARRIKELEQMALLQKQAQFFIETPYRNRQLLDALLVGLRPNTQLFIGANIGGQNQFLRSRAVAAWRNEPELMLQKLPTVFGVYS